MPRTSTERNNGVWEAYSSLGPQASRSDDHESQCTAVWNCLRNSPQGDQGWLAERNRRERRGKGRWGAVTRSVLHGSHAQVHSGGSRACCLSSPGLQSSGQLCVRNQPAQAATGASPFPPPLPYLPVHAGEFAPCNSLESFRVRGRPVPAHNATQCQRRIWCRAEVMLWVSR